MVLRLLTALSLVLSVGLAAPAPAVAATAVGISLSATELEAGETLTVSGRASGTPGTRVRLQRRLADGWQTVETTGTTDTRRYRFDTRPPRGHQSYRVLRPSQDGRDRAVSGTRTVAVFWTPRITGTRTERITAAGRHATGLEGTAPSLSGTALQVQRHEGTAWTSTGETTRVDGSGRYAVEFTTEPVGTELRLRAAAVGTRREASSPVLTIETTGWYPEIATETSELRRADDVWVTRVAGRAPQLPGGALDVQQLASGTWVSTGDVATVGDDGTFVHDFDDSLAGTSYRFHAPADGERLAASSPTVTVEHTAWTPTVVVASATPVHRTADDGMHVQSTRVAGTTDAPGAGVWVFATTPDRPWLSLGSGTTAADGSFDLEVRAAPDGAEVTAVVPEDGPRSEARSAPVVARLAPWPLDVDGDWFGLSPVLGRAGGLLTFDAAAGEVITFELRDPDPATYDPIWYRVLGPDGQEVPEQRRDVDGSAIRWLETPTSGTYTVVLDMPENHTLPGEVEVRATRALQLTGSIDQMPQVTTTRNHQVAEITFAGDAGEAFHLPTAGGAGHCRNHTSGPYVELLEDGAVVPPVPVARAWQLPEAGEYTLRLFPCERWYEHSSYTTWLVNHRPQLVRTVDQTVSLPESFTIQPGAGRWGRVAFEATAGSSVTFEKTDWNELFGLHVVAPDGTVHGPGFTAPVTGTYHLWAGPAAYDDSFVTVRGTSRR